MSQVLGKALEVRSHDIADESGSRLGLEFAQGHLEVGEHRPHRHRHAEDSALHTVERIRPGLLDLLLIHVRAKLGRLVAVENEVVLRSGRIKHAGQHARPEELDDLHVAAKLGSLADALVRHDGVTPDRVQRRHHRVDVLVDDLLDAILMQIEEGSG